ncbi:MAG: polyribonucleotide nucleotidyltransferase, partial [Thermovirgaceae bacterium]
MQEVFSVEIGGERMVFETGTLAKQASGAVKVTMGETVVLVTACVTDSPREGLDFFPLLVDYEERFYSAGKIPGGFIKREGRPSETAVLTARLTDRSIRSLFPQHMRHDVHVVVTTLSVDQENPPNVLAINGASAALAMSEIPWSGPVGAVRIGCVEGELVVNPTETMMSRSTLDLVVSGHRDGVTMVEAGSFEVSEETLVDALDLAQQEIRKIVDMQIQMAEAVGKEKMVIPDPEEHPEIDSWISENLYGEIYEAVQIHEKKTRSAANSAIKERAVEALGEIYPEMDKYIGNVVDDFVKKALR